MRKNQKLDLIRMRKYLTLELPASMEIEISRDDYLNMSSEQFQRMVQQKSARWIRAMGLRTGYVGIDSYESVDLDRNLNILLLVGRFH